MWCDSFLDTAEVLLDTLSREDLVDAWDRPSALQRMTLGQLAGHTARAVLTTSRYLDRPGSGEPVDAVGYILAVTEDDDLSSPLHRAIRARAAEESEPGPAALADTTLQALTHLRLRLPEVDPGSLITVFGDVPMRIDHYLETRLLELVVHLDDLAASLDTDPPPITAEALNSVADLLAGVAEVKHGAWAVIRAFTRRERMLSWPGVF